jgi:tRNA threonylcarbamoyl adenosine modification protein YeaZ
MQKQKINYLTLQSTYDQIEVGLFNQNQLVKLTSLSKFTASSELVPAIQNILAQNLLALNDLNFICANLGPAPFTTLRTTIVTVNGLSYASKICLVGVNGLHAFARNALPENKNLIIILNAYSKSIYYAFRTGTEINYGWQMLDIFLSKIQLKFANQEVVIIGLGIINFESELSSLPSNFVINKAYPGYPDLNLIARVGLEQYQEGLSSSELAPLYLKQAEPL